MLEKRFEKNENFIVQELGNEYVLVPLHSQVGDMNHVFSLKGVGAFIWERISTELTVNEIVAMVEQEFDVNYDVAKHDVIEFLSTLAKNGIVTN